MRVPIQCTREQISVVIAQGHQDYTRGYNANTSKVRNGFCKRKIETITGHQVTEDEIWSFKTPLDGKSSKRFPTTRAQVFATYPPTKSSDNGKFKTERWYKCWLHCFSPQSVKEIDGK